MITFATSTFFVLVVAIITSSFQLKAKDVNLAVGQTKLPYIYNDFKTGYQLELVDAVLKKAGHRALYTPTEHARNEKLLLNTNLDGVMNIDRNISHTNSYLSDSYFTFHNVAVSLKSKSISVKTIENLADYDVVSFSHARRYFNNSYREAVGKAPLYVEVSCLSSELKLILAGRADVLIMDYFIFAELIKEMSLDIDEFHVEAIFEPTDVHILFKEEAIQEDFDRELYEFLQSENYLNLRQKYLGNNSLFTFK